MIRERQGPGRTSVASKVRADDGDPPGEQWRNQMPCGVRARVSVQQDNRRPIAADADQ